MEDFLLRTKSTLVSGSQWSRVHGVLGGEEADISCVASTLGYAYYLSQRAQADCVCIPVLSRRRCEAGVPEETRSFLQQLGVSEQALLWREDIDLLQLHSAGKLSLTLLHTDLLNSVEDGALASCVVKVINCSERRGGGEGALSTAMVAREILQEAPEQLTPPLAALLRGALLLESAKAPSQDGRPFPDHEELLGALGNSCPSHCDVIQNAPNSEAGLQDSSLDQILLKELKEFTDGDIKVSVSMVSVDLEAYSACPTLVGNLKSFCDRHGYEGLVILSSSLHDPHRQCQQVAVFSGNKDILNQICCELEEGRSCSLGLEPLCCVWETIQLYRQRDASVYTEQILSLLRDFLDRRQPLFLLNSRTSSTEGVAGSAPLSQGSSGITDMYSSDAEPANAAENVPEPGGAPRGLGDVGSELVSPDSGLATVRSSRSSKESSVFLSDDSPVAETTAGFLHNPALSFPSLCAAAAAASSSGPVLYRERDRRPSPSPSARNVELFAFDPLRSPCSSPAAGGANEQSHSSGDRASSSLSEFGELSLVDFYTGSSDGSFVMDGGFPSPRLDPLLPATPLNSLTEEGGGGGGREGVPKFFPKEVAEKMSTMGKKESVSSSEPWDDFTSDTKGSTSDDATAWSLSEPAYLGQESPDVYLDPQVGSKGGQGDDDSFLLVSVDSEATHSAGDDIFWATPNPTVSLDTADAHLGQVDLQMLPAAGETQEDAGSEPSAEIRKSWGYFDGVNDDPVARISDAMRLLDPFSFPTTQNQPEGLEVTDAVHSSLNQESCPAVPLHPEGWEYQEERKDLSLKDRTSSSQSTDHQPTSGTERLTTGDSVSQTKWVEPDGECTQPLKDAEEVGEGSVLQLVSQHTPVKQESCDKERQPAVTEYRDQHLEQEVGQFPDKGTTSPDTPEARTLAFPDITAETAKTHLVREVVLPSSDSTHMWNPFIPMTQPPETYDNWNPNLPVLDDTWRPGTLGDLQLTPPVEDMPFPPPSVGEPLTSKLPVGSNLIERAPLTPETSKEEDKSPSPDRLDFWSYSAQRGFLQATEPYPESLGLWNTTIRDDSQSTLSTPDLSERSDSLRSAPQAGPSLESPQEGPQRGLAMWNTTIQDTSPEGVAHSPHDTPGLVKEELDQGSQASSTPLESDDAQVVPQLLKVDYSDQSSKGQEDDVTTLPHRLSGHLTLDPCAWGAAAPSGMVKSVSEYDNVDPGEPWHQTSPELEPCQEMPEEHHPVVEHDGTTEFQLLADAAIERPDSTDDSSCHSPFVLLGVTPPLGGAMFPINQREDTPCPSTPSGDELSGTPSGQDRRYDWDDLSPLGKMERVEPLTKEAEDGGSRVCWDSPNVKLPLVVSLTQADTVSRETDCLEGSKTSPDPQRQVGSREDVRSNSDGDSSGLEMEYIMVSGRGMVRDARSGETSPLYMCLTAPNQSNTEPVRPDKSNPDQYSFQSNSDLNDLHQINTDTISCDQSNTEACRPLQPKADLNDLHQITTDSVSPIQTSRIEIKPHQSNTNAHSICQTGLQEHLPHQTTSDVSSLHQPNIDLNNPFQSNTDLTNPDQMTLELNSSYQNDTVLNSLSNGSLNTPYETDLQIWRQNTGSTIESNSPHQSSTDLISPHPSVTDSYSPFPVEADVGSPQQSNTDANSPYANVSDAGSPYQSNVDSHSLYSAGADIGSPHQSSTDASVLKSSSVALREPFSHFRAMEEVYVRSQISLEDSEEEGAPLSLPQNWALPVARDLSPGESSGPTDTPESDLGSPLGEVRSPFAFDLTEGDGDGDRFFMNQAGLPFSGSMDQGGHRGLMILSSDQQKPMGGQHLHGQGECKADEPTGDQLPQGNEEHLSEQPIGDQLWPGLMVSPPEQPMGGQLWPGVNEPTAEQPMGDQIWPAQMEPPAEQPMKDQLWTGQMEPPVEQLMKDQLCLGKIVPPADQPMGDQLCLGKIELPAEQPMGDQLWSGKMEPLAEQPMGDQLWSGQMEPPAEQPMGDQLWSGQMEPPAEQPMVDQLLPVQMEPPAEQPQPIIEKEDTTPQESAAAKDSGGVWDPGSRTEVIVMVTSPDHSRGASLRSSVDDGMDVPCEEDNVSPNGAENRPAPPCSLDLQGGQPQRKKLSAPEINLSLDQSEGSILSDDALDTPDDLDINVDELDTPDEADSLEYMGQNNELEWEESGTANEEEPREPNEAIPEYTAEEERQDVRLWRTVIIGEQEHRIDMKSIELYQKVISHGGYYGDQNAIIVFAACFLPDSSREDYHYVMENLFLYVISTLELMVAEDYMIVYLNGATPRRRMPGLGWLKKCYQMIDRRLRKNLKSFIIVHPSWFIRTILAVTRPFISSKFSSKIKYVSSLAELRELIPMEYVHIPESIVKYEEQRGLRRFSCLRLDEELKETADAAKYSSFLNGGEAAAGTLQIDKAVNAGGS